MESSVDGDSEFWALRVFFDSPLEAKEWERTCTAVDYLLRPYWCEAEIDDSVSTGEVLKKMPTLLS